MGYIDWHAAVSMLFCFTVGTVVGTTIGATYVMDRIVWIIKMADERRRERGW